jgi:hypothetical protein
LHRLYDKIDGGKKMSTTATDAAEPNAVPQAQPKAAKTAATPHKVDKYAEARLAKKKQRRRAHRATIRRSNTNG